MPVTQEVPRPILKLNPDTFAIPICQTVGKASLNPLNSQAESTGKVREKINDALLIVGRIVQRRSVWQTGWSIRW
jgi:hypothetical protein